MPNKTDQCYVSNFGLSVFGIPWSFIIGHSDFSHGLPVNVECAFAKADQDDLFHRTAPLKKFPDFGDGNSSCRLHGKPISAGADRRESDCARAVLFGQGEGIAITTCKQFLLAMLAVAPDRSDRVDHPSRRKPVTFGDFRLA